LATGADEDGFRRAMENAQWGRLERFKNILQWFLKRLCCHRLLDNWSFRGLENLQVNAVQ
jgi:hypothetical protein